MHGKQQLSAVVLWLWVDPFKLASWQVLVPLLSKVPVAMVALVIVYPISLA